MIIYRYTKDWKLYTISYTYGINPGRRFANPYNRPGKGFEIKSEAMWKRFIPVLGI